MFIKCCCSCSVYSIPIGDSCYVAPFLNTMEPSGGVLLRQNLSYCYIHVLYTGILWPFEKNVTIYTGFSMYQCLLTCLCTLCFVFASLQNTFSGRVHINGKFPGSDRLPNTCNFSIKGPNLHGRGNIHEL